METNWCILEIDENGMWARIALKLPEGDEIAPISAEHIEKLIPIEQQCIYNRNASMHIQNRPSEGEIARKMLHVTANAGLPHQSGIRCLAAIDPIPICQTIQSIR